MTQRLEYTVLEIIESASRIWRATPLTLAGNGGPGGGVGGPPGGFIGQLPQYRVAYDTTEAATLATLPSGLVGTSGWSLVDNLNHIRYRLNILESGGSITIVDDNDLVSYQDTTHLHFSGAGVTVVGIGGGHVQAIITATGSGGGGGLTESEADDLYLRLDTSNDPLTAQLDIIPDTPGDGGVYILTEGDSFSLDVENITDDDNMSVPTAFVYRESTGTADFISPMVRFTQNMTGTGDYNDGDFLLMERDSTEMFKVDKDGVASIQGIPYVWEANIDGLIRGRKDGDWELIGWMELSTTEDAITGTATATIGKMHVCSGTSSNYTVTLPATSGNNGKYIGFRMSNALTKLVTLDGNSSETIDGELTRVMWKDEVAILYCDGANWFKVAGKTIPMACSLRRTTNQTISNNTVTKILLDQTDLDNTGAMANTGNNRIDIRRNGTYSIPGVVVWNSLSANTTRLITEIKKSGTGVGQTEAYGPSGGYPAPAITEVVFNCAAGEYIELHCYQNRGGNESLFGAGSGSSTHLTVQELPTW